MLGLHPVRYNAVGGPVVNSAGDTVDGGFAVVQQAHSDWHLQIGEIGASGFAGLFQCLLVYGK